MKLTGKCKEAFEKWNSENNYGAYKFEDFNESMQYGVYVDFFDSVNVRTPETTKGYDCFFINEFGNMLQFKTRPEARKAAIQKANEIFNQ